MQKGREGYGTNWTHFVYKLDNLFRSITVSYGNSSVTKIFHFLNLFEFHSFSVFKMHHSKTHHQFSTLSDFICYFSCIYDAVNEKHYKWTLKRLKVGMVSSFHPHSMCNRVERVTAKTGRTSCTNWTISSGVSGFRTRTHLLHWHFIFLNLLQLQTFLRSVHTIQSEVINFQNFITSFAIF